MSIRADLSQQQHEANKSVEFLEILDRELLHTVYQPIVSLEDLSIFGYEALSRTPKESTFQSPLELFRFAEQSGNLFALEQLAREKAVKNAVLDHSGQMLFINVSAAILQDPKFVPGKTLEVLERNGVKPNNVVFEITERSSFEDFSTAKKILEHYRAQGYKIAIDDAGAGYSSLQAIAELHPDFIKVDRSLIHEIHRDKIKETILETFVTFAHKMNIQVVAEGIERMEELIKITQMGVHYAQGYLLGRPSDIGSQVLDKELVKTIRQQKGRGNTHGNRLTIGNLAAPIRSFEHSALVSQVAEYFHGDESASGTVIVRKDVPVGLLMRENLFRQLSGQYGHSLFWKRMVESTMDGAPLVVDESLSLEQVSRLAMSREKKKLYDYVIITRGGQLAGVASIQSILESITEARMESAKIANPLTGLPGNLAIHREINSRLGEGMPFSVIYADLDYFKWYNDRFGFQKGDQLIQFTAEVIQFGVAVFGSSQDFVGHIGGDDFIAISGSAEPDRLCLEIIRRFDEGVVLFRDNRAESKVEDRNGNPVDGEGMTLSLSLVICECRSEVTFEQISQAAAALKKHAKAQKGSVYSRSTLGMEQ